MKVKTYFRVSRDPRAPTKSKAKVVATSKPNHAPLIASDGSSLPTVAFAVELDLPDEMFARAEQVVATLTIPEGAATIAAEVTQPVSEGTA